MERHEILDMMGALKLAGMRHAYDEVIADALKRQHSAQRVVGDLLKAEIDEKQARSIKYQMTIAKLPLAEQLEKLRDPDFRAQLIAELPEEGHPLAQLSRNWNWLFPLSDPPNYEPPRESSIAAQAEAQGRSPEEVAMDLLMNGGDGKGMLYNALGNFHEGKLDALLPLMQHKDVVLGLGDGGAHYAAICDASYSTFLLTYWTRDRAGEKIDWASAVRALTFTPADTMCLSDRGLLKPGYKADVNVIDAERLALHRPEVKFDLPTGGRRLDQAATENRRAHRLSTNNRQTAR